MTEDEIVTTMRDVRGNIYKPKLDEHKNLLIPLCSERADLPPMVYYLEIPRELIVKMVSDNDNFSEKDCELCKKIQNDLYQMSAKYNVSNQQDYFIVMGIYLAIELIAKNYVNKADDDTEHQAPKMFVHFPKEKE